MYCISMFLNSAVSCIFERIYFREQDGIPVSGIDQIPWSFPHDGPVKTPT